MKITIRIAAGALTVLALAACTPKKLMLSESFFPGSSKVAKTSIKVVGTSKETTLSNYYIQVCDVQSGTSSGCKTTLILENVTDYQVKGLVY